MPESWETYQGKRSLIIGEVKTGKTLRLKNIIQAARDAGETSLAILDMAPDLYLGIGGKLYLAPPEGARYLSAPIHAPRLMGKSPEHTLALARENAHAIEGLLARLAGPAGAAGAAGGGCLFINDLSLYLQAGNPPRLLQAMDRFPSVVANGYYGVALGDDRFSQNERRAMEEFMTHCHQVIRL